MAAVLPARAGMAPRPAARRRRRGRAPRASGDGPRPTGPPGEPMPCSPRERGWPQRCRDPRHCDRVLPARAGMAPSACTCGGSSRRAPRASGDGPGADPHFDGIQTCSPRERGWPHREVLRAHHEQVLPARAGMARAPGTRWTCRAGAPRASGDGPDASKMETAQRKCSPRERGWPRRRQRALHPVSGAPRASGDGPRSRPPAPAPPGCSPRERGWPAHCLAAVCAASVLPARAGMAPTSRWSTCRRRSAPRASGDDPWSPTAVIKLCVCSPRERGWPFGSAPLMYGPWSAPRASGDGPETATGAADTMRCSPRERGWPQRPPEGWVVGRVLPARAGMAPPRSSTR